MFVKKNCFKTDKKCSRTKFVTNLTKNVIKGTENVRDVKMTKWPFVVLFGIAWYGRGLLWPFMAKYGYDWTWIAFSRGHRSKFIWSWYRLKYFLNIVSLHNISFDSFGKKLSIIETKISVLISVYSKISKEACFMEGNAILIDILQKKSLTTDCP